MSLPPGFMDELRSRTSLAQVVGRKVLWDTRKSNQAKGDLWAPCPFHQEKTASFHVDDRKGYYYCFGCHEKGDALSFVQKTENVGFMEAVEILAGEAGMQMPARDPQAQQKAEQRNGLRDVVEAAQNAFRLWLNTAGAADARAYLERRGLSRAAQERFGIGFAPDGWQTLWDHLRGKGFDEAEIIEAGLAKPSTKGGKPYDVFRNRIIFPIRDPRDRVIAFGGRAMDPKDNAKYLNSPETPLFDKGRTLYNHGPAREAAGKGAPLIVAEGYMDVIALSEAGFGGAVAPLGTAVTEHHLAMLWRISDEPIIALDGDKAGIRAAHRVIDLALPLLEAGKGLRFALMPDGQDPDDLIRAKGAEAVQAVLDAAQPMVRLLWQRETAGKVFDSPERKAALDKALRDKLKLIGDPSLRRHYGDEIKDLRWQLFRPATRRPARKGFQPPGAPVETTKASLLAAGDDAAFDRMREAVILAALLLTPDLVEEFETQLEAMPCTDPVHARLRDLLLAGIGSDGATLRERAEQEIGTQPLETLLSARHVAVVPCVRNPGDSDMVRMTVAEELAKLEARRGLLAEIAEAEEDLQGLADEAVTWRLRQAAQHHSDAERSAREDRTEYDIGPNGAAVNREERSAFDALMAKIKFSKGH
ncbi:MAG: DNA primase [Roseivivax sp.]|nr:DNA primase [Roseivivax sp.]